MTVLCQGYQLIGSVAYHCNAPSRWDLVTQSDSDALVSAQCDRCLPQRLRGWYGVHNTVAAAERDNLVVLPHDPARWQDEAEDEAVEYVHVAAVAFSGFDSLGYVDLDPERAGQNAYIRDSES